MANTVWSGTDKGSACTLSGGNLTATMGSGGSWVRAVDRQVGGLFYFEATLTVVSGVTIGVAAPTADLSPGMSSGGAVGTCAVQTSGGAVYVSGTTVGVTFGAITAGTVLCIAVDATNRRIWFRLGAAGNWNNNVANNPATGVGGVSIFPLGVGIPLYPALVGGNTAAVTANFGDTAFTGAVPSGFTSGFTAGASVPTNAIASQALAEHWLTTNPTAQVTSVVAEHWASVASDNLQAVVTFVALEHWTSVAVVVPAAGGPMVTMIH